MLDGQRAPDSRCFSWSADHTALPSCTSQKSMASRQSLSPMVPRLRHCSAVLAANLLCRLPDPQRFLARLPSLIKPGGVSRHAWRPGWLGVCRLLLPVYA